MNYILSAIYLIAFVTICSLIGDILLDTLNIHKKYYSKKLVCGFIYISFVQWIIGFCCQLFHTSWNFYFISLSIIYLGHLLYLMYFWRKNINADISILKRHLSDYWFIYLLVGLFTLMSISSQFPYFELNYDDAFYLGSIVQEIGSDSLNSVNFFNGLSETTDITRIFNTLSLQYAYCAELFSIEPVAFARFTMSIQNYYLIFLIYHIVLVEIKGSVKNVQYLLLPFSILLIPAGYLSVHSIISAYDDWQLNTAMWYGSSLVRLGSLPVLLYFGFEFIDKATWQKFLWLMVICISFFSFSSIVLPVIILTFLILGFYLLWKILKGKNYTSIKRCLILLAVFSIIFLSLKYLIYSRDGLRNSLELAAQGYQSHIDKYLHSSIILILLFPILCIYCFIYRKHVFFRYALASIVLCIILFSGFFNDIIMLFSMKYNFVGLRLTTSVQMMVFLLFNYILLGKVSNTYMSYVSLLTLFLVCSFNVSKLEEFKTINFQGAALSKYGYSIDRVLHNDSFMPSVMVDIKDYFDSKETKFNVIAPTILACEGADLRFSESLVYTSHNIGILSEDGEVKNLEENVRNDRQALIDFVNGTLDENIDIAELLNDYNVRYIISPNIDITRNVDLDIQIEKEILYDQKKSLYLIKVLDF